MGQCAAAQASSCAMAPLASPCSRRVCRRKGCTPCVNHTHCMMHMPAGCPHPPSLAHQAPTSLPLESSSSRYPPVTAAGPGPPGAPPPHPASRAQGRTPGWPPAAAPRLLRWRRRASCAGGTRWWQGWRGREREAGPQRLQACPALPGGAGSRIVSKHAQLAGCCRGQATGPRS